MALKNLFQICKVKDLDIILEEALSGIEAIKIIEDDIILNNNFYSSFDWILTDYQMPILDGNECTQQIRNLLYSKNIK